MPTPRPAPTAEKETSPEIPEPPAPSTRVESRRGFGRLDRGLRDTQEKALAVDPALNLKLCVARGELKINGWERNELRVFVKNGPPIMVKALENDESSKLPIWVWIAGKEVKGRPAGPTPECLLGDSIEIDVPKGASLNISGRTASTSIDTVKKVSVRVVEGRIDLRNISGGISAEAFQGDVLLTNSSGQISLQTTTGNVIAFDVKPGSIGDLMKVRTNSGSITLENIAHRQIDASSISGSVNFKGKFLNGGIYSFKTSNGSLRLLIPADSSCKVVASYGFGTFNSDIPYKLDYETVTPGGKNIIALFGGGAATVNVTTAGGSIGIRKQE